MAIPAFVLRHFERYRRLEPWPFCWRITLEGVALSLLAAALITWGASDQEIRDFGGLEGFELFLVTVILAPILETFIFQAFPVFLARLFRARPRTQIIVSVLPFTLAHIPEGLGVGIAAGLVGGFYLAFTYVHWRSRSRWTALWVTTASHFLRNLFSIGVVLIFGGAA